MNQEKTLLVITRGWCDNDDFLLKLFKILGGDIPNEFANAIASELKYIEILQPKLEMGMFSMRSAESLSKDIYDQIEKKLSESKNIKNIILLGYSSGSVLVRRVFTMAHGAIKDGSIDERKKAVWADKIDRTIILSGITRGWQISSATPAVIRFFAPILENVIKWVGFYKQFTENFKEHSFSKIPFILQLQRGAPFIISTRLQYLAVLKHLKEKKRLGVLDEHCKTLRINDLPSTVFILGAQDEYISPVDCTELGPRSEFVYFELPGSNHMDALKIYDNDKNSSEKRNRLCKVISLPFHDLCVDPDVVLPDDIDDYIDPMDISNAKGDSQNLSAVKEVVMVIHGIRDHGFWTKRVAREIKKLRRKGGDGVTVRVATPSYGFFSLLDFLFNRDKATYWFLEKYAEIKTYYPEAQISFIGHSNGTYLAARALQLCEAVRFKNMVFTGSVVRRDFWQELASISDIKKRVSRVLNYVAEGDGVVAFFPGAFEKLRFSMLNLGGAGAFGFNEVMGKEIELNQIQYIRGSHGAAISEKYWRELAEFIILDKSPDPGPSPEHRLIERSYSKKIIFLLAPLVTFSGLVVAILLLSFAVWFPVLQLAGSHGEAFLDWTSLLKISLILSTSIIISWLTIKFLNKF